MCGVEGNASGEQDGGYGSRRNAEPRSDLPQFDILNCADLAIYTGRLFLLHAVKIHDLDLVTRKVAWRVKVRKDDE